MFPTKEYPRPSPFAMFLHPAKRHQDGGSILQRGNGNNVLMGLHGDPQHTFFHMSHYITQQVAGIATFDYRIQILFPAKNSKIQFFYKITDLHI